MTEEEPFSVFNVYWYNKYFDGPENPHICTPVMYRYHVIFTPSKDPDENVKQMIEIYVGENNIKGLYKYDPFGICLHYWLYLLFKYFDILFYMIDIWYLGKPVILIMF